MGSKSEIYALVDQLASQGMAVIVVTSEMNEILGICDRIITVYEVILPENLPGRNFLIQPFWPPHWEVKQDDSGERHLPKNYPIP